MTKASGHDKPSMAPRACMKAGYVFARIVTCFKVALRLFVSQVLEDVVTLLLLFLNLNAPGGHVF